MSLEDVRRGVAASTVDNPKGQLDGAQQAFQIGANDQLLTADAYQDAVIAYRNGAPVLLRDVGQRHRRRGECRAGGLVSTASAGRASWTSSASPAPTPSRWWKRSSALLPKLQRRLPPSLKISVVDRPHRRRSAPPIADVQFTLVLTVALVVHGDLPVPAQAVGDGHSRASRCRCR